ncbi:unnamed protein product [Arctogadus glacialis]
MVLSTWGCVSSRRVRSAVPRRHAATQHFRSPPDAGGEVTAHQRAAFISPQAGTFTADPLRLTHNALGEHLEPQESRPVRGVLQEAQAADWLIPCLVLKRLFVIQNTLHTNTVVILQGDTESWTSNAGLWCFGAGLQHPAHRVPGQQGAARSVDAADGSGRSAAGGSGAGSAVVESAAGESTAGGSAAGESGAGSAAVSAAGESGAGSTAGGSSAGAAVADAGADPGAVNVAAGATGSVPPVPYFEEVDLDIEEQSEPKKQQAPVAAENLSISQSAGTEAASTSCTGRDPTVITNEGKGDAY